MMHCKVYIKRAAPLDGPKSIIDELSSYGSSQLADHFCAVP